MPPSAEAVLDRMRRRRWVSEQPTRIITGEEAVDAIRARQELHKRGVSPIAGGGVPGAGFVVLASTQSLSAATVKTVLSFNSGSNTPVDLIELGVSMSVTSGNCLIELCYSTAAGAGTSSAFTPLQVRGPTQTMNAAAAVNYTAEPTTLTRVKGWRLAMPTGPFVIQFPLGREPNSITAAATSGKQICVRLTSSVADSAVDVYAELEE